MKKCLYAHLLILNYAIFFWIFRIDAAIISNVRVPQDEITVDSIIGSQFYYSGVVYYDLEQIEAGSKLHIYIENPPCKGYQFGDSLQYNCHADYQLIDALSSGDLGLVQPGKNKVIQWRYATSQSNTYAEIKIGIANAKTILTKSYSTTTQSGGTKVIHEYFYNSRGQMFKDSISYFNQDTTTSVIHRTFNNAGQITATDSPPETRTRIMTYDSLFRLIDSKYLDIGMYTGWTYQFDEKSRTVSSIPYSGIDSTRKYSDAYITKYDEYNRMVYNSRKNSSTLATYDIYTYDHFSPKNTLFKDSTVVAYYSKNILTSKTVINYSYNSDSTVSYTITTNTDYDSLGNGSFDQRKKQNIYDNTKNLMVEVDSVRNSPDSPFTFHQVLNTYEYDRSGNKTHWWSGNKVTLESVQTYNSSNLPVTQAVYSNVNDSLKLEFIWKTIDLDTLTDK